MEEKDPRSIASAPPTEGTTPSPLSSGASPATNVVALAADIRRRVERATALWALTTRQAQVLAEVARGHGNRQIAEALRCAESTIEVHMTALLSKAGCHSRAGLVAKFWIELS